VAAPPRAGLRSRSAAAWSRASPDHPYWGTSSSAESKRRDLSTWKSCCWGGDLAVSGAVTWMDEWNRWTKVEQPLDVWL